MNSMSQIRCLDDDSLFNALNQFGLEPEKIKPSNRAFYETQLNQFLKLNRFKFLNILNLKNKKTFSSLNNILNVVLVVVILIFAIICGAFWYEPNSIDISIPKNDSEAEERPNFATKSMGTNIFQTKITSSEELPKIFEESGFDMFTKDSEILINVFI